MRSLARPDRILLGMVVAGFFGAIVGAAVGWYNELTADDVEELHLGFAEYSMYGMAVLCSWISGVYGAIGASISCITIVVTRKRWTGIGTGLTLFLVGVLLQPAWLLQDEHRQAMFIWMAGFLVGSVAAVVPPLRTARSVPNSSWTGSAAD